MAKMKLKNYIFVDKDAEERDLIKGLILYLSSTSYIPEFIGEKIGEVIHVLEGEAK